MPMLILKFEGKALREIPVDREPVTIGRAPDNAIPIDNLAVSNYHARIETENGRLFI
jgi:pSer/pThr/pTyr-binding forkhead associated (FHA) protein